MGEKRNYTALVFKPETQDYLIDMARPFIPKNWESRNLFRFGHHISLCYDRGPKDLGLDLGMSVDIGNIVGFAINKDCCAFLLYDQYHKLHHVSMGVRFGISPVVCNSLTEKDIIATPISREWEFATVVSDGANFWNRREKPKGTRQRLREIQEWCAWIAPQYDGLDI